MSKPFTGRAKRITQKPPQAGVAFSHSINRTFVLFYGGTEDPKTCASPSGNYFIQPRIGGESEPSGQRQSARPVSGRPGQSRLNTWPASGPGAPEAPTLTAAIDAYIEERAIPSPLTIRGYRTIQKHRQTTMPRRLDEIGEDEWQVIVNAEAAFARPKR